jgi:hypothetical protein
MVACAQYLGREISSCTRGMNNCLCRKEDEMKQDKDDIKFSIGAIDWANLGVYEISEKVEELLLRFVEKERQACADLCRELYLNDAITCAEAIEERSNDGY